MGFQLTVVRGINVNHINILTYIHTHTNEKKNML